MDKPLCTSLTLYMSPYILFHSIYFYHTVRYLGFAYNIYLSIANAVILALILPLFGSQNPKPTLLHLHFGGFDFSLGCSVAVKQ